MDVPVLFSEYETTVEPTMIDYSGHLNVGYYLLLFEDAARSFFQSVDLSQAYRERTGHALFAIEAHLTFEREVREGDRLRFETQLLGATDKAIDVVHFMRLLPAGDLAATNEILYLHMNLASRRPASLPDERRAALVEMEKAHASLGTPPQAGRRIVLKRDGATGA